MWQVGKISQLVEIDSKLSLLTFNEYFHQCILYRVTFEVYSNIAIIVVLFQGWLRLEKYLNLEGFLEKSLKIK